MPVLGSSTTSSLEDSVNYAVVMDAGSSGTRAYLYSWPQHSGDPHQLLKWDSLQSPVNLVLTSWTIVTTEQPVVQGVQQNCLHLVSSIFLEQI